MCPNILKRGPGSLVAADTITLLLSLIKEDESSLITHRSLMLRRGNLVLVVIVARGEGGKHLNR